MPKRRVVTSTKPMRFVTTYGGEHTVDRQQHAEEREAKRWLTTRLDNAAKLAAKYEPGVAYDQITDIKANLKGRDLMALKPEHIIAWQYTYDGVPVSLAVKRLP